ncbi:MAG: NAD-dependent deacylase [Desulfurococcales archaeon]|nr:NAD-dependent deacylase [Desulfurococcales archaeon]
MSSSKNYESKLVEELAEHIVSAGGCSAALTGAGISTPSGIPDFRSPGGLWSRIDPSIFDISTFHTRPDITWINYAELVREMRGKEPNPAHIALAQLEEMGLLEAVITQNIDGLHQKAGSRKVIELHGNAYRAVCMSCGSKYPIDEALAKVSEGRAPLCPKCGGLLKPDVVFFGEALPHREFMTALSLAQRCRVFMSIGSSLVVQPAASLPLIAHESGAYVAIINLAETPLDSIADTVIRGRVEVILPELVNRVRLLLEG